MVIFKYVMCVKGWNVEIIDNDESFDRVAGETRSEVIVTYIQLYQAGGLYNCAIHSFEYMENSIHYVVGRKSADYAERHPQSCTRTKYSRLF